jgi:hypothetical protein
MIAIKKNGWLIAAVMSVVLACVVILFLEGKTGNPVPIILLVSFASALWRIEKHRGNALAAKKMIAMAASVLMLFVMKVKWMEEFMQSHVGTSGYAAALLLVAPIIIWVSWIDLRQKLAEEEAEKTATAKGAE